MEEQKNGMAVAGFILALVSVFFGWVPVLGWVSWVLGIIFSAIGISKAKNAGGKGKGLAIAGLIICLLGIVLIILLMAGIFAIGAAGAL